MSVLLVANEWISKNATSQVPYVNRQLAKEIAGTGLKVYSTVIDPEVPESVVQDAKKANVTLLTPTLPDPVEKRKEKPTRQYLFFHRHCFAGIGDIKPPVRLVIGHAAYGDSDTAGTACSIVQTVLTEAELWVFVHINPDHKTFYPKDFKASPSLREEKEKQLDEYKRASKRLAAVGQNVLYYLKNRYRDPSCVTPYLPYPEQQYLDMNFKPADVSKEVEILMVGNLLSEDSKELERFDCIIDSICDAFDALTQVIPATPKLKIYLDNITDEQIKLRLQNRQKNASLSKLNIITSADTSAETISSDMERCALVVDGDMTWSYSIIGLNSMASGVPCLISNRCGLAEFINTDEDLRELAEHITVNVGPGNTLNSEEMVSQWTSSLKSIVKEYDRSCRRAELLQKEIKRSTIEGTLLEIRNRLIENCPKASKDFETLHGHQPISPEPASIICDSPSGVFQIPGSDPSKSPCSLEESAGQKEGNALAINSAQLRQTNGSREGNITPETTPSLVAGTVKDTSEEASLHAEIPDDEGNFSITVSVEDGFNRVSKSDLEEKILDPIKNKDQLRKVNGYIKQNGCSIGPISHGESLVIPIKCNSLEGLETIWSDMWTRRLDSIFRRDLINKDLQRKTSTSSIRVNANIKTWEYQRCKAELEYRLGEQISKEVSNGVVKLEKLRFTISSKVILDPIHGPIELGREYMMIVDTPEFQRLRNIKKLGTVNFVYPGAVHTRFEHSIGRCYLALKFVKRLKEDGTYISTEEELCIGLAALCLDLGEGPFSHLFEERIVERLAEGKHIGWTSKQASVKIFESMVTKYELRKRFGRYGYEVTEDLLHVVKEMIYGPLDVKAGSDVKRETYQGLSPNRHFLYDIVSNKTNLMDVNEWDGLARDCYHLGIMHHGNPMHERFIKFARVLQIPTENEKIAAICYRDKEATGICEMLRTRYRQRELTTFHTVKIAIDMMISDAFQAAADHLTFTKQNGENIKMTSIVEDIDAYLMLDDNVIDTILQSKKDEQLRESREILERIQKRQLYKLVGRLKLPPREDKDDEQEDEAIEADVTGLQEITAEEIVEHHETLEATDLCLTTVSKDYGLRNVNPIERMHFYRKDSQIPIRITRKEISYQLPPTFQDQLLLIYVRNKSQKDDAKRCIRRWARTRGLVDDNGESHVE